MIGGLGYLGKSCRISGEPAILAGLRTQDLISVSLYDRRKISFFGSTVLNKRFDSDLVTTDDLSGEHYYTSGDRRSPSIPGLHRQNRESGLAVLIANKCLRQRTLVGADDGAGIDVVPREPAVPGFQNE